MPDGAIVGLLAVLLGTTVLVWGATGLGALISHGHFPHPLPFLSTAPAIRHLATAPNDLPGAWPGTPAGSLPSPAAFWLTFFALLAVALTLLISAATARAKRRAAHSAAVRRATVATQPDRPWNEGEAHPGAGPAAPAPHNAPVPPPPRRAPGPREGASVGMPGRLPAPVTVPVAGDQGASADRASWSARSGTVPESQAASAALHAPGQAHPPSSAPSSAPSSTPPSPWTAAPPSATVPRPGGATAAGWARAGARAGQFGSGNPTPRFTMPPSGTVCVFAPEAGSAARRALVSSVIAETKSGPLVVVTSDPFLWDTRPPYRRALRFDPQHVTTEGDEDAGDTPPPRGRWAPHSGCAEPVVATARARALLLPTARPVADREEQAVRALAETLLRCWLRAAALDGRPFRHVARWATGGSGGGSGGGSAGGLGSVAGHGPGNGSGSGTGGGRQEAVAVLQSAATAADVASGDEPWAGQLQAALLHASPTLDAALGRVRAALGAVAELHVLAACTPGGPESALDPEALLTGGTAGSLYVLGRSGDGRLREPGGDSGPVAHSAMPLLSALVDDVVQRAWHSSPQNGSERPLPGPLLVLDDIAAVAPFPTLPQLMADGTAQGLRALTLLRSPEQARARWGERAVHSLWTTADHRAVLGPLSPAPLAALLASVGAAEYAPQPGLGEHDMLLLPGRHHPAELPQRFRITAPGA
ncbi:hypothetical protein ABH931_005611 [Streptacidiphilus sp. MAP12-33]|uniref:TraM recognition domain-containing protein n=1 Tax=Streptacidiphilus sp. MAP12-33 TaxID=3156266 RepID=UPI003516B130